MLKQIINFFDKHLKEVVAVVIAVFVLIITIIFSGPYVNSVGFFMVGKQVSKVDDVVKKEFEYISQQRQEIIESKVFDDALIEGDPSKILDIAQFEVKKRELDYIVVTDKNGFVLARTHLPNQIGDNVFQTTAQGVKIGRGETVTAVVRGAKKPLALSSASVVLDEGKVIGSVILGYLIDDSFANRIKEKYLNPNSQVIFYTSKRGLVGSSFNDDEVSRLLSIFFSVGSDIVTRKVSQLDDELKIDGRYYMTRNLVFPGIDNQSPGGAIVFLPDNHNLRGFIFACFAFVVFLAIYLFLSGLRSFSHHRHRPYIIFIVGMGLFFVSYAANYVRLDMASIELKDSPYPIYNSTISFEPSSDIIHPSVKTTVAIKVRTGGEAINVVRATIKYDPSKLKVLDILTGSSLCGQTGFLDKSIDDKAGLVKINCVTPNINPGFYEPEGTVAELVILPLTEGGASLQFVERTEVLASDGLETDVLRASTDAFYQVTRQGLITSDIKEIIPVFSSSHPNSNAWYRDKSVQLSWPALNKGVYYYAINQISDFIPQENGISTLNNRLNTVLGGDGIYYFHIRAKNAGGKWGDASHFKIMVDSTPPQSLVIKSSSVRTGGGELVRLNFNGEDKTSGVQKNFYVKFDEGIWFPTSSQLYAPFFDGKKHNIYLRVFDNAGNFSDMSKEIISQ